MPIASWLNAIGVAQFAVHHAGTVEGRRAADVGRAPGRETRAGRTSRARRAKRSSSSATTSARTRTRSSRTSQAAGLGGGTEHASAIFYGESGSRRDGRAPATGLVYHEIAHQWFGDSVTESDWDDVWLSEGFATYFTLLFTEHAAGRDAFVAGLQSQPPADLHARAARLPACRSSHDNLADMGRVLNNIVYQKGGWTLHMLRESGRHRHVLDGHPRSTTRSIATRAHPPPTCSASSRRHRASRSVGSSINGCGVPDRR